jgi:hypothetical protein
MSSQAQHKLKSDGLLCIGSKRQLFYSRQFLISRPAANSAHPNSIIGALAERN